MHNYSIRKYLSLGLLCSLMLVQNLAAQEFNGEADDQFYPYLFINGNIQAGLPLQIFKQKGQSQGYGGGGLFLVQVARKPVFIGLEASIQRLDEEGIAFEEVINGFVEEFEMTAKSNILLSHVVARFQPWDNGLFRPYVDGLVGAKYLFTRTTTENINTEETESTSNLTDWTLSYGMALGLQLGFFKNEAVTVDIRCSYLTGNNANFMVRRPDATGSFFTPIEAFEEKNAPATMLIPQIGVTVDLSTVDYY